MKVQFLREREGGDLSLIVTGETDSDYIALREFFRPFEAGKELLCGAARPHGHKLSIGFESLTFSLHDRSEANQ